MKHYSVKAVNLPKGARLLTIDIPNARTGHFEILFRNGFRFSPRNKFELPHVLEHAVFEGSKQFPSSSKLAWAVEQLGAEFNGETDTIQTKYEFFGVPDSFPKIIEVGLDMVFQPVLSKDSIEREIEVIKNELVEAESNYAQALSEYADGTITPGLPPDTPERLSGLAEITPGDVRRFHKKYYVPQNTYLILAGDFSEIDLRKALVPLRNVLSKLDGGKKAKISKRKIGEYRRVINTIDTPPSDVGSFDLRFVKRGRHDQLLPVCHVLQSLCEQRGIGLLSKAREYGLTYELHFDFASSEEATYFSVSAQAQKEKLHPLLGLVIDMLRSDGMSRVSDEELDAARNAAASQWLRGHETPYEIAQWYGIEFLLNEPLLSPDKRAREIQKVDRAALLNLKSLFNERQVNLTLMGPKISSARDEFGVLMDFVFAEGTPYRLTEGGYILRTQSESIVRTLVFSAITLGGYLTYWMIGNWRWLGEATGKRFNHLVLGIFWPFTVVLFLARLNKAIGRVPLWGVVHGTLLTVSLLAFFTLGYLSDPFIKAHFPGNTYLALSVTLLLAVFVAIAFAQKRVNELIQRSDLSIQERNYKLIVLVTALTIAFWFVIIGFAQ